MKNKVFILFILLISFGIYSQTNKYRLKNLSTLDGLSQSSVIAIHQDLIGQMWFGTRDGLNKYDGSKFTIYRNISEDSTSISNNDILSIQQEKSGKIWIGTYNGLNCFDPVKNIFKQYFHANDNISLCNNTIWDIKEIKNEIWIGTSSGLSIYNKSTKKFISLFHSSKNRWSLPNNFVLSILEAKNGVIWIGTSKGLCRLIGIKNGNFLFQKVNLKSNSNELLIQKLKEDNYGNIWIGTKNRGLYKYVATSKKIISLIDNGIQKGIDSDIRSIDIDSNNNIWVGTYNGVSIIKRNGVIEKAYNNPDSKANLKRIKSVYTDKKGSVWIGTYYDGVSFWDVANNNFNNLDQESGSKALSLNVVSSVVADKIGNIYIGTGGGGISILNKKSQTTSFLNTSITDEFSGNNVKSMYLSDKQILWIGTLNEGLLAYDINSKRYVDNLISSNLRNLLRGSAVYCIKKGRNDDILWLGTFGTGLIRYDITKKTFQIVGNDNYATNFLTSNRIRTLLIDKKDNIWIGTQSGLNCINLNDFDNNSYSIKHYFFDNNVLSGDDISTIYQDKKARLWIGVKGKGLYLFKENKFQNINISHGDLIITSIHSISEDSKDNLWIGSNNGIIKFQPSNGSVIIYDQKDGVVGNEYNDNSILKFNSNQFYFGGPFGISYFNSDQISQNNYSPQVILTDFKIKNKALKVGDDNGILENTISYTKSLTLSYDNSNFSINFAIPNFVNSTKNQYMYRLVGLENNWTTTSNVEVYYTLQRPGTYMFEVKGANNDGVWNSKPTTLEIIVNPAPWRSGWAFLLYLLIIGSALYGLLGIIKAKENLKRELELEHVESRINSENTQAKLQFFTNISHEFRTPLTLILGPLQQIIAKYNGSNEMYKKLLVIENSANHLLSLINRLMDFRKFETNHFILESAEGNIVKFLREIFLSFTEYAKDGNYTFTFNTSDDEILVYYDRYKLERVFFNLLSNAFRYTPKGGSIILNVKKDLHDIIIEVEDTGLGIPPENLDKIFDLFYEIPKNENVEVNYNKGSGIGLSIAKNIVLLHKGTIKVNNNVEKGATFSVKLPLGKDHLLPNEIISDFKISDDVSQYISQLDYHETPPVVDLIEDLNSEGKLTILLVEDHKVLRSFMKNLLSKDYNVVEAENGKKGLLKALEIMPDLIISDVVMPEMVGTELCAKIKENIKTSHIPVILLTSRTSLIYKIEGLEKGADDYISKPFEIKEFQLRIKNLLDASLRLKAKFSNEDSFSADQMATSSIDEILLKKAFKVVEENIGNEQFDIPFFSSELGVSRTMLFIKIKAWTNLTPNEFIQEVRMKRAAQLLEQNKMNVSQISYKVGFNNPKYFSKCFQKRFGETPTQYANKFTGDYWE